MTRTAVKAVGIMSCGRYASCWARGHIERACNYMRLELTTSQGAYWHKAITNHVEWAIGEGFEWLVFFDSDTLIIGEQLAMLLETFCAHPEIHALASLQAHRNGKAPLYCFDFAMPDGPVEHNGQPFLVESAHFGCTALRAECFADLDKPWFFSRPDKDGGYRVGECMDADIWFWRQWRRAGKSCYVHPGVMVGHVEETVLAFDEDGQIVRLSVDEWREKNGFKTRDVELVAV